MAVSPEMLISIRQARGYSTGEVADAWGISLSDYRAFERGGVERRPEFDPTGTVNWMPLWVSYAAGWMLQFGIDPAPYGEGEELRDNFREWCATFSVLAGDWERLTGRSGRKLKVIREGGVVKRGDRRTHYPPPRWLSYVVAWTTMHGFGEPWPCPIPLSGNAAFSRGRVGDGRHIRGQVTERGLKRP